MAAMKKPPQRRSQSPELQKAAKAWREMVNRCTNSQRKDWKYYGGKGVRVSPEWTANFQQFLRDMGLPPTLKHWLARRDTSGHFTPDNCLWTTREEQMRRREYCRQVVVDGRVMTAKEASRLPEMPTRNAVIRRWTTGLRLKGKGVMSRSMRWLTYQGVTMPLTTWARRIGVTPARIHQRLRKGMPMDKVLCPTKLPSHPITQNRKTRP